MRTWAGATRIWTGTREASAQRHVVAILFYAGPARVACDARGSLGTNIASNTESSNDTKLARYDRYQDIVC